MDWKRITNKFHKAGGRKKQLSAPFMPIQEQQVLKDYFIRMTEDLNFRMLCEMEDTQMLWIDSITVTGYEIAQKNSRWEQIKRHLLGRGGKKTASL